jgi:hypothetical protein
VIVALLFAFCALGVVQRDADAYTGSMAYRPASWGAERGASWSTMTADQKKVEIFRMREWLTRTKPAAFNPGTSTLTTSAQATANQKVWTTAGRARLGTAGAGTLGASLVTAGLFTAAAGIWTHNGIILYNASQCGQTSCPENIVLDAQFRAALDAQGGASAATAYTEYVENGNRVQWLLVTKAEYKTIGTNGCRWDITYRGAVSPPTRAGGSFGVAADANQGSQSLACSSSTSLTLPTNTTTFGPSTGSYTNSNYTVGSYQATGHFRIGNIAFPTVYKTFGPQFKLGSNVTWENPIFDAGVAEPVTNAPSGSLTATPETSHDVNTDVQDNTCTPSAPPETTPETCPDYFPDEWDPQSPSHNPDDPFPDVGEPGEFDDPYGDPDQDGDPNHTDPDDDGDGKPDETDPQPWVAPLPDSPEGDPDGDGIPNVDDPDDDGDGIPDEYDPAPYTPTNPQDLPLEHPYADPDGDGIPNKDDTDDDGDGIPDEVDPAPYTPTNPQDLPDEHPYADPDQDGTPNKDDLDDDGDGIPDEVDPNPYDPTNPDLQPDDPYADPDGDGIPNRDDTDDDGDGVPDVDDPAPYDPTVPGPEPDPTQDTDGDGYPDVNDPAPNDPTVPMEDPYQDADGDGWPNWNDPAPNDPTVPTGDPTTDTDGDGWPDFNDPAPNDPTVPTGDPTLDTDGDGTPDGSDPAPNDPNNPTGGGGGGGEDPGVCPVQKPYNFDVPRLRLFNVFPFSLVLKAWNIMQSLVMPPQRPVFNVPLMGQLTVSDEIDAHVQTIKTAIAMVLFIGMLFWFWRMITGKGADGGAT